MTVVQTSLEAFRSQRRGAVGLRQKMVYDALLAGHANDQMLSRLTGLPINCVTPRRGELEKLGLVVCLGPRKCPFSGRSTYFYARVEA